jgi:hypothetical protein
MSRNSVVVVCFEDETAKSKSKMMDLPPNV